MENCSYCKEYKPCRKVKIYLSDLGVLLYYPLTRWICKDCDDYFSYLEKERALKFKKEQEDKDKMFIKKRNSILNKIRNSTKNCKEEK